MGRVGVGAVTAGLVVLAQPAWSAAPDAGAGAESGAAPAAPHAPPRAATPQLRVAVLPLDGLGVPEDLRESLATLLNQSVATIPGTQLVAGLDLELQLRPHERAALAVCHGEAKCALALGRAGGVDTVLVGTVAALGRTFSLSLRALDVASGRELGRQRLGVSGSRDALIPAVRLGAYQLLAPRRIRGALAIEADVAGVAVNVDGVARGLTPLPAPVDDLTPGPHQVEARRAGYAPMVRQVDVAPFTTRRLVLKLQASP